MKLSELSLPLQSSILYFLDIKSMGRCSSLCKYFNKDIFWREAANHQWNTLRGRTILGKPREDYKKWVCAAVFFRLFLKNECMTLVNDSPGHYRVHPVFPLAWSLDVNELGTIHEKVAAITKHLWHAKTDDNNYLIEICISRPTYAKELETLLQMRADPNTPLEGDFQSPLHFAAAVGNLDAMKILLNFKADPSIRDSDGKTAQDLVGKATHLHKRTEKKAMALLGVGNTPSKTCSIL